MPDERVESGTEPKPRKEKKPLIWEWIVATVGLVLVVSAIGFMLYRAIKGNASPPVISISVDSIMPTGDKFLVTFRAVNHGELTAAGLTVEGELRSGTQSVETSSATLNYVPSRSKRRGGLFFINDPRKFELKLRPKGYEQP
ncbi:MAG: hypothetical protein MSG64_16560 [Pyrinomonadaceae bacterium MAG19_C2-C3]|nr:hypothetical protein [Pyrinomonadaceae bacterium MAG19_C2-C3]